MKRRIYIASPYSHVSECLQNKRYAEIRDIVGDAITMFNSGAWIYSPIVYSHPLAQDGVEIDWVEFDKIILEKCDAMFVVKQDGWHKSLGIQEEIQFCFKNNIPFCIIEPEYLNDEIALYLERELQDEAE